MPKSDKDSAGTASAGKPNPFETTAEIPMGSAADAPTNPANPNNPLDPAAPVADDQHSNRGLMKSAGVVAVMTIFSRVLGLWRFRVLARMFGATYVADAFNFAFIAPNLTRRLFGEGALTSAFVPVFSEQIANGEHEAANRTGSVLITKVTLWLSIGCAVVIGVAALIRLLLLHAAPQLATPSTMLLLQLFQWMLPYLIFINVACVLMAILNSLNHFWMPNFAPVLLNVLIIGACYFVAPYFGASDDERIWAVAYAVLLGGVVQLLVQVPPAFARGFRFRPSVETSDPGYRDVLKNFKPVILLVAVFQANVLMDNIIAKEFIPGDGPVTYLNMGTSVYQMVWSIVALALATVSLPALSKFWALGRKEDFNKTLLWGLRMAIFWTLPCTVGIMLLSDDIVRLLYGTGKFLENDAEPVRRTAGVALYSGLGLVFFSVNALLARALYAMKDMRTPTTTSAWSVVINIVFNLIFVIGGNALAWAVRPFLTDGVQRHWSVNLLITSAFALGNIREGGIALASTISNGWQTYVLAKAVYARTTEEGGAKIDRALSISAFLWQAAGAALLSAGIGIGVYQYFIHQKDLETFWAFFAAIGFGMTPFYILCREHFVRILKPLQTKPQADTPTNLIYGVAEDRWPEMLKFQYSIYSSAMAAAIMGFVVWAMRDSLPPEGRTFGLVAQRALAPVAAGVIVYIMAASGWGSREWDEFKGLMWRRIRKPV